MAGDWIKMLVDVHEKPEVIHISDSLKMDVYAVVGRLHRIWSWFSVHTCAGNAPGVTPAFIDRLVSHEGFAAAMAEVAWLSARNDRLTLPNFDRHNSKSAKSRALLRDRVKRSRNASTVTPPLPEKRREEKSTVDANASTEGGAAAPPKTAPPPDDVPIPLELDTVPFRTAWDEYLAYRKRKKLKPLLPVSIGKQFAEMAAWGAEDAVRAINKTIANGWQGLFPPSSNDRTKAPPKVDPRFKLNDQEQLPLR
jgi:hypothetical protein